MYLFIYLYMSIHMHAHTHSLTHASSTSNGNTCVLSSQKRCHRVKKRNYLLSHPINIGVIRITRV